MKLITCGRKITYKYGVDTHDNVCNLAHPQACKHEEVTVNCGEILKNPEEIILCLDCKWRNKIEYLRSRICEGVTFEPKKERKLGIIPQFHDYICPYMKNRYTPSDITKTWDDFELKICPTCKAIDEIFGTKPPK